MLNALIVITLCWTAPTQNEDGTPLTDLDGYKIYEGGTSGGPYSEIVDIPDETQLCYDADLPAGEHYFVATAYNEAGVESQYSGEAYRNTASTPKFPQNLTVLGDVTVWAIQQTDNVLTVYPVGTIAIGTSCDNTMTVNGLFRVDKDLVDYAGSVRPPTVYALCSGSGT